MLEGRLAKMVALGQMSKLIFSFFKNGLDKL
jgi:hypothetical protein